MIHAAALLVLAQTPGPVAIARAEILAAAGSKAHNVQVVVRPSARKEAYSIDATNGNVRITGSDPVGAMYGAFEFAERLRNKGAIAWSQDASGAPFLPDRGLNLFLTLPWDTKKNDTDYAVEALTDPDRWWFQNDDYWTTLLDLMAHSRLNWLDIHGAWDISVTNAPNLYAYFVTSPSFPKVGVPEAVKAAGLRRLNWVIAEAHRRGIRVSLMAYEANLRIPQNPNPGYEASEANVYRYTREVVEQMIRKAPGLDAIGFRIGESGRGEEFFNCYGEAVKASGRDIPLITRSWITRKQKVLPLARASKDFTVEIKYNGEQWGAPYLVAGGRVANWYSYSFEDYLSDSGSPLPLGEGAGGEGQRSGQSTTQNPKSKTTWPGWPTQGGGNWPSQPYKVVWQVRANGTHRIFPFYNPDWVRRSIQCMKIGTASGYTIEGIDAYYPKSPDYYLADPASSRVKWTHQRDAMYWITWGRLGYNPKTPDAAFDRLAAGRDAPGQGPGALAELKRLSILMPKAFMGFSLGPDHRSHAPELEWGGPSDAYVQGQGFDSHAYIPINEELANRWTNGIDGRRTAWSLADELDSKVEGNDMLGLMGARSNYMAARLRSAYLYAAAEAEPGSSFSASAAQMRAAEKSHSLLADSTLFRPFTERLRMHTNTFHWKQEHAKVLEEARRVAGMPSVGKTPTEPKSSREFDAHLSWREEKGKTVCRLIASNDATAWLLYKPLPSSTYFHRIAMNHVKLGEFEAELPVKRYGYAIAAEVYHPNYEVARRFPDPRRALPYLVVPSKPGPTPQIYSSEEALAYLDPSVITPQRFSAILIGTRAWGFFGRFGNAMKRKILDPVSRGIRLVILQQDFNRYKLDWLPKPLRFEGANLRTFDPGGQLGLEKVETDALLWQRFLPSEGWEVFGNGGLARLKHGKGEVWVTSARLMQRMHIPGVARNFVKLLSLGGTAKPTILVDSCSEGADFSSSCHPDLMNSHDIPFLTLGEVIAEEQGMNSFTPILGPAMDDDVLGGKGRDIANSFLRNQVVQASKRPTPKSIADFEVERSRRRRELMRCLGLDPMPTKTPLNARITGVIQRDGYRIEKVVFESRPRFYVTAHVYSPSPAPGETGLGGDGKYPVIVNVNGHWAHKKNEDRIQLRCAFQARRGYIAIAIDSPGWSFEGNSLIERRAEGSHNDWALVQGGLNATAVYVWDAIRALDYMATRPDADMTRIGITGASGGGLATLYTFAADDRYTAAVPVVYMSSMELAPDNGCLCNHVPGTSQIGDRSDVLSIQAPKPVFIMGAENDPEFPPDAMRLTATKAQRTWDLFPPPPQSPSPRTQPRGEGEAGTPHPPAPSPAGRGGVECRIFPGPHDYNQAMREASIGFFDLHLKGQGDGSPVPQPPLEAIDPEDRRLLAADPPTPNERTMRDLALEYLRNIRTGANTDLAIAINGGRSKASPLNYKETGAASRLAITFDSEPGLITPGVLIPGSTKPGSLTVVVDDDGKKAAIDHSNGRGGRLYLDILGTGELSGFELRYPIYLGRSVPFTGGWQIVRAVQAMRQRFNNPGLTISLEGRGPISTQAIMWAGLMDSTIAKVSGTSCLASWEDVFRDGVSPYAIQPRANLLGSLNQLRERVPQSTWTTTPPRGG